MIIAIIILFLGLPIFFHMAWRGLNWFVDFILIAAVIGLIYIAWWFIVAFAILLAISYTIKHFVGRHRANRQ